MRKLRRRAVGAALVAAAWLGARGGARAQEAPGPAGVASAELPDGRAVAGRLERDEARGFVFRPEGGEPIGLGEVRAIAFDSPGPGRAFGTPTFQVGLGGGGRISGELVGVDGESVTLDVPGAGRVALGRRGVRSVVQRPGAAQVFRDGFEGLDRRRWSGLVGDPQVVAAPRLVGEGALRLPAGGSALTMRLDEPIGSGALEVAFLDDGRRVEGQRWFVDLTFRGGEGQEATVRAVLGWAEETLAVESPGGPRLHVQRLLRRAGWHRLSIRFGPEQTELAVDGDELAFGRPGLGLPLAEVRLATEGLGDAGAPRGLAAVLDDLALSRRAEPFGSLESEPSLDEVRLTSGDQLFGRVRSADASGVEAEVGGRPVALPWSDVAGLFFRRDPAPAEPVSGWLARVEWAASAEDARGRDRVEGAIAGLTDDALELDVPYLGRLGVPRDRLRRVEPLERALRIVLDPGPYHLGDRYVADLDPPRPEPEPLELAFTLDAPPEGAASLCLDVVQVIGVVGTPGFSERVAAGELRTRMALNGRPLDDLNTFITAANERPERVRVPIPPGTLRAGRNVLRFEQTGEADAPARRDNLGLLGVAIESPRDGAAQP
jgi:hypothetical protein